MPAPLDESLRRLAAEPGNGQTAAHPRHDWVFRGYSPGRPITAAHVRERLRQVFSTRAARLRTLHELTKLAPVAVIADTLGYASATIERHATASAATCAQYVATRRTTRPAPIEGAAMTRTGPCAESNLLGMMQAAAAGAGVGLLGGLIGLGGAEFRLPLLIGLFAFAALHAVILNKAMSLIVVAVALPARLAAVPWSAMTSHWHIIINLLAGSLLGAWVGATWATRMRSSTLYKVLAALLVLIAVTLLATHLAVIPAAHVTGLAQIAFGITAGFGIGVVAALMGVAGGELLIPTIVLLYSADIKLAGSLSLAVSLPTMLVAFARYSRDASFAVLRTNLGFLTAMAGGSVVGTLLGGLLLGAVPTTVLIPALAAILLLSARKVWQHR